MGIWVLFNDRFENMSTSALMINTLVMKLFYLTKSVQPVIARTLCSVAVNIVDT